MGGRATYGEFHQAVLRWADGFRRLGIGAGDNVAAMVQTSISTCEHWVGLGWLRAVHTGVNTDFRGSSLAYVLNNCRARHMICGLPFLERVAEVASQLEYLELVVVPDAAVVEVPEGFPFRLVTAAEVWEGAEAARDLAVPMRHEIACITYTSGTTGASKGILVPWGRLWPVEAWMDLTGDDAYYDPFPTFHLSGLIPLAWLGFPGGRVVLRDGFKTRLFWEEVRAFGCTRDSLDPGDDELADRPAPPSRRPGQPAAIRDRCTCGGACRRISRAASGCRCGRHIRRGRRACPCTPGRT